MIDEILTSFYEDCKPETCEFGHLYYAGAQYPAEELQLWRPSDFENEVAKSYATTFVISKPGQDAFRRKYPLSHPQLAINEEFPVIRVKPRPVVLLIPPIAIDEPQQKGKGTVWRPHCLVGPIFQPQFPELRRRKVFT